MTAGPTSIFVNGRVVRTPGSYSEVDAAGLNAVGLGALGIVAVLGESVGGMPISAMGDDPTLLLKFNRPEKMQAAFRSGDLREVADMLFAPSKDPDILSGAASVFACKTNPATQATAALTLSAVDVVTLTSLDYGAFADQINVEIGTGTTVGKSVTIRFEDIIEEGDDIGGVDLATLMYSGGTLGLSTATMTIAQNGDITINGTRAGLGQSNLVTTNLAAPGAVEILSSNAGDVGIVVTIFGFASDGTTAQKTTATLNGTTPVAVTGTWGTGGVLGLSIPSAAAGIVTVRASGAGAVIFDMPAATLSEGLIRCEYVYVDRIGYAIVADGASTAKVAVFGRNAAGSAIAEVDTLNGTTPVASSGSTYAMIDTIAVGAVAVARTVTLTPTRVARTLAATQDTLQKVKDYFDAKVTDIGGDVLRGFIFTFVQGSTGFLAEDLDLQTAVDIKSAADGNLRADLFAVVEWINDNSVLIEAEVIVGATGAPDNTATPLFLSGGGEGTALFSHYQTALNLLKRVRVNTIVDLSGDPAVAAAVDAHCAFMCGIGRNERDGVAGVLNDDGDDVPTLTEFKAAAVSLNSKNMRVVGQAITRFGSDGEEAEFLPPFFAALVAGLQAGAPVGTPLTHKFINVLGLRQDSSWNPTDDSEELIEAGLLFAENLDGIGRRIVRNNTTHLSTSNIAFTEASVNQSVNVAVYEFRTTMEYIVGRRGFSGSVGDFRANAMAELGLLVEEEIIAGWRGLDVELVTDVMDVSVEMAPVIPINFVRTVVHLVTLAQLAAGNAR